MPLTRSYHFVITFAEATSRDAALDGSIDRAYRIAESPQHRWTISEHGQPVAIDGEQQSQLAQLLAGLAPLPDPAIAPEFAGSDGTWVTVVILRGDQQVSYRWWVRPPAGWEALGAVVEFVQQLADAPREQEAQRQRQIARQFFDCLAARDLAGMLAIYHPDIQYHSPFFQLRGAEVGALWRMAWSDLPDLRVVCTDSAIRGSSVYWIARYTYPPTGRYVEQQLTADLAFAEGKIIRHADRFNVHDWAHRAYGGVGRMLGGSRVVQRWVAGRARARLAVFRREQGPDR